MIQFFAEIVSETNSLDSLIRRYQEKELIKLKEKEPELFRQSVHSSTLSKSYSSGETFIFIMFYAYF